MRVYDCKNRNVAGVIGCNLLRNVKVKQAIQHSFKAGGLTNKLVAESLKRNILEGAGKNAKASDSLKAIEILFKLWGLY